jgi:LmbE family N-acetylglucosaminyl deacetylase
VITPELTWREHLKSLPSWLPHSEVLTIVAPHPDDETLGAGGLISACAELGMDITLILVTDGEKARPEIERLASVRSTELRKAMMRIAPDGARIIPLHIPEGGVAQAEAQLTERLVELVSPRSTLIAPFEQDGQTDYEATARACMAAAKRLGILCARYPIWAWDRLGPEQMPMESMRKVALTPEALNAKRSALACYASQIENRPGGPVVPAHVLEHFDRPYEAFLLS